MRLVETALAGWTELDGYAVAHNMPDLRELPLDRFCHFVWYMMTKNAESDEVAKLRAQLWQPPIGEVVDDPRSPWAPQNEGNALSAFKASIGG